MVTTKKEAEEFAKQIDKIEGPGKPVNPYDAGPFAHDLKHHAKGYPKDDRGELDLTRQIDDLKLQLKRANVRIADLTQIEDMHRRLNGELRKDIYQWKMKAHENAKLESQIIGQKQLITDLTKDNQRLAEEVNDKVDKLRNAGII